jgi:hypothetical protein
VRHLAILRSQDSVPGKGTKSGKNRAKWCIAMAEGSQFSSAPSDNFSLCVCVGGEGRWLLRVASVGQDRCGSIGTN